MSSKVGQNAPVTFHVIEEVLTVAETAALLKVPASSVYEWTRYRGGNRGTPIPHRKVGKYLRFLRSEVETWLVGLPQAANTRKRHYVRKPHEDAPAATAVSASPAKVKAHEACGGGGVRF